MDTTIKSPNSRALRYKQKSESFSSSGHRISRALALEERRKAQRQNVLSNKRDMQLLSEEETENEPWPQEGQSGIDFVKMVQKRALRNIDKKKSLEERGRERLQEMLKWKSRKEKYLARKKMHEKKPFHTGGFKPETPKYLVSGDVPKVQDNKGRTTPLKPSNKILSKGTPLSVNKLPWNYGGSTAKKSISRPSLMSTSKKPKGVTPSVGDLKTNGPRRICFQTEETEKKSRKTLFEFGKYDNHKEESSSLKNFTSQLFSNDDNDESVEENDITSQVEQTSNISQADKINVNAKYIHMEENENRNTHAEIEEEKYPVGGNQNRCENNIDDIEQINEIENKQDIEQIIENENNQEEIEEINASENNQEEMEEINVSENNQEEIECENFQKINVGENIQEEIDAGENIQEEIDAGENIQEEIDAGENIQEEIDAGENIQEEIDAGENIQEINAGENNQKEITEISECEYKHKEINESDNNKQEIKETSECKNNEQKFNENYKQKIEETNEFEVKKIKESKNDSKEIEKTTTNENIFKEINNLESNKLDEMNLKEEIESNTNHYPVESNSNDLPDNSQTPSKSRTRKSSVTTPLVFRNLRPRTPCNRCTRTSLTVHCDDFSLESLSKTPKKTPRRSRRLPSLLSSDIVTIENIEETGSKISKPRQKTPGRRKSKRMSKSTTPTIVIDENEEENFLESIEESTTSETNKFDTEESFPPVFSPTKSNSKGELNNSSNSAEESMFPTPTNACLSYLTPDSTGSTRTTRVTFKKVDSSPWIDRDSRRKKKKKSSFSSNISGIFGELPKDGSPFIVPTPKRMNEDPVSDTVTTPSANLLKFLEATTVSDNESPEINVWEEDKKEPVDSVPEINNIKKRLSNRRSVMFNLGDADNDCGNIKHPSTPIHPNTRLSMGKFQNMENEGSPRSGKRSRVSLLPGLPSSPLITNNTVVEPILEDLISFDSPAVPKKRSRKSGVTIGTPVRRSRRISKILDI